VLEYDFENSAGFWIMTTAHEYERAFNDELAPEGITLRQCQVLGLLALSGPQSQNELAERMRIEPPTLVGILDRMERDGWIRRTACPTDRRRKLIQPLAAAKPVWARIVRVARRLRARATRGMSTADKASLRRLLKQVRENIQSGAAAREAG
jgi:MarR family transcriptional regulator for hemolysin